MPAWTIRDDDDRVMLIEVATSRTPGEPPTVTVHVPPAAPLRLDAESAQQLRLILAAAIRESKR